MDKIELETIIEKLEQNVSIENGTIGLYYRDGEDECHLKANKDGFKLFAIELLKASINTATIIENKEKDYIPSIKDDLFKFGCFAIIGILALSLIIGIYTIFTWF